VEEAFGIGVRQFLVGFGPVGQGEQLRREQLAAGEERLQAGPQIGIEEPGVRGGEHGGEDAEGVAGQFFAVDGTKRGRHDGHRAGGGFTQVVEPHRVHAHGPEDASYLLQFTRRADPDGAVAFRGHPADGSEAFGVGALHTQDALVDLA
jgi:hypothetical protein